MQLNVVMSTKDTRLDEKPCTFTSNAHQSVNRFNTLRSSSKYGIFYDYTLVTFRHFLTLAAVPSATDLVAPLAFPAYPLPSTCGMLSPMIRWRRDPFCNGKSSNERWRVEFRELIEGNVFFDQIRIPSVGKFVGKHKNKFKVHFA